MNLKTKSPLTLIILDGFGYSESPHLSPKYNAILMANTPNWDKLWQHEQHCLLDCSGKAVGLPDNQMGNSEVGHMNISAGRVIYQDLTKIDLEIESEKFFSNPVLQTILTDTKIHNRTLHVCGLVSDGGVHSHLRHYLALANMASQYKIEHFYVHAFLDGRDTPPKSALSNLIELDNLLKKNNIGKIVSIIGRYYAMDRDKRWDRTNLAFDLLTGKLNKDTCFIYPDIHAALNAAYERGETDEFVKPTIIASYPSSQIDSKIKTDDNLIFMNFRADRARQLSELFTGKTMPLSDQIKLHQFVILTQYEQNLLPDKYIAYPPTTYNNMLGEFLSKNNYTQLRIAETEKYAHVTFFFNGGKEEAFPNEDRILIPSPKVKTYDLKPEMSAYELTTRLCEAIENGKYDVIICNYANPDMVGHTGDLNATIKAIEVIDECIGNVVSSINKTGGQMLITADHGNAECMFDQETKQAHTAHTNSLVPLLYYGSDFNSKKVTTVAKQGSLIDIAPTLLYLIGLQPPLEMTGNILFKFNEQY